MRNSLITALIILGFCWLAPAAALADHLPESKIARGKSDAILSGVDVNNSTIRQVIAKLGQPTKVTDVPSTANVAGGRDYEWQRGNVKLQLGTWNDKGDESIAYSAEVWGTKSEGKVGQTGRGLKLGATMADVRRIYGPRFSKSKRDDGTLQVIIQWKDDTTLYLYFDKTGHVYHMHLLAATE
jgi:hypothetical protein